MNKPLMFLGLVFFFIGAVCVYIVADSNNEDHREIRQYGNLECVYNKDRDEVESCVKIDG